MCDGGHEGFCFVKFNQMKQNIITVWYDYLRVKISSTLKVKNKEKIISFHHSFVMSFLSLVVELVRWWSSRLSFDVDVSVCSITIDGNCWFIKFDGGDSFVEFINGRSSSGPRKFKLNLRILNK